MLELWMHTNIIHMRCIPCGIKVDIGKLKFKKIRFVVCFIFVNIILQNTLLRLQFLSWFKTVESVVFVSIYNNCSSFDWQLVLLMGQQCAREQRQNGNVVQTTAESSLRQMIGLTSESVIFRQSIYHSDLEEISIRVPPYALLPFMVSQSFDVIVLFL